MQPRLWWLVFEQPCVLRDTLQAILVGGGPGHLLPWGGMGSYFPEPPRPPPALLGLASSAVVPAHSH